MDPADAPGSSFLQADEVDEPALDSDAVPIAMDAQPLDVVDGAGLDTIDLQQLETDQAPPLPQRPSLRRDQWASGPQQPPPPAPPRPGDALNPPNPEDSLSLGALKKIVNEFPKFEPTPYAFVYQDYSNFPEELDELFGYAAEERASLLSAHNTFTRTWHTFNGRGEEEQDTHVPDVEGSRWTRAPEQEKKVFLETCAASLRGKDAALKLQSLDCILYVVLGTWFETAGHVNRDYLAQLAESMKQSHADMASAVKQRYKHSTEQLAAIQRGIALVHSLIGPQLIFDAFREAYTEHTSLDLEADAVAGNPSGADDAQRLVSRQLWSSCVILYLIVDFAVRSKDDENASASKSLASMEPQLMPYLTEVLADMRWDDSDTLPSLKIFLLYWKITLLTFGDLSHVEQIKSTLDTDGRRAEKRDNRPLITASPLDYHIFRQEITSKYPSFEPPVPLFPFEPESNSIVPPLQDRENKAPTLDDPVGPASINGSASSIIHQPVHIATPAPSPPPSPAGPGGKGVKKQNYQTNQMFPFMYPPLEGNSNSIGGKGSTELQDLVGRKWTGRDIPTSILEAADLFANRMRATRAMKQLWKERVRFMKYERGYGPNDFSLDDTTPGPEHAKADEEDEFATLNEDLKQRLANVEAFYAGSLPQLQSVVIVFMKVVLQTVTALVTQPNAPNGLQNGFTSPEQNGHTANGNTSGDSDEAQDPLLQDLDMMRSQEIMSKAVSGTMLILLKWFKTSHVLKFEYLTQLILDSNYVQLLLKLFTHQEPERVVNYRCERRNLNFLRFCQSHSRQPAQSNRAHDVSDAPSSPSSASSSADEAAPPPITRQRPESGATADFPSPPNPAQSGPVASEYPEVDELGNPVSQVQTSEPITTYSWRNFFSLINHVRVLQKVVKHKAHRQLLMVQYKYASVLRKNLKVPQPDVRLYTLKTIKGQVPYSHRKWRQGNMRIITAIYLHCRPELRDEWLAGIDVDQEMMEALPHERALRSLTYWHNLRLYPEAMGTGLGEEENGGGLREGEQDFFVRELERMDLVVRERSGFDASFDGEGPANGAEMDRMTGNGGDGNGVGGVEMIRGAGLDAYIM